MVMVPPIGPDAGDNKLIAGAGTTVKVTPVLTTPSAVVTVTETAPFARPAGTVAVIDDAPQVAVATVEPNFTVPGDVPKPVPEMMTLAPIGPMLGPRLEIDTGLPTLTAAVLSSMKSTALTSDVPPVSVFVYVGGVAPMAV